MSITVELIIEWTETGYAEARIFEKKLQTQELWTVNSDHYDGNEKQFRETCL